ncbi:MAG: FecR family protein [bacterium]|nr:FecR family protein [bacterium]
MKKIGFIIVFILIASSLTAAETFLAKAELLTGKVTWSLKKDKKAKPVKIGQKFVTDSVITTGKKSSITLKLKNKSLIELKENSKLIINKDLMDKASVSLLKGNGKFNIQKLMKSKEEFNVYTPTAVVGVRGTEYELGVAPDGSLGVNVGDGKVAVNNDSKEIGLGKNESTVASLGNDQLAKNAGAQDLNALNKSKEEEMNKNPADKMNAINNKFDKAFGEQQAIVSKLSNTKNTNVGQDISQGLFNQAKTEGLYSVAQTIKNNNPQDKLVSNAYKKINSVYDRLNKLNQIMDEKFNNLDKIYDKKTEELMKKLDNKEKMFNDKFKDFDKTEETK